MHGMCSGMNGNCGERGSTLTGNETCSRRLSVVCRQDITTDLNVRIASFILQTAHRKINTKACSKRLGSAAHLVVELQNGQARQQYEKSF